MVSCERCWADAHLQAQGLGVAQADIYRELIEARTCSPEQQAGPGATRCRHCGRLAVHQHVGNCMACGRESAG